MQRAEQPAQREHGKQRRHRPGWREQRAGRDAHGRQQPVRRQHAAEAEAAEQRPRQGLHGEGPERGGEGDEAGLRRAPAEADLEQQRHKERHRPRPGAEQRAGERRVVQRRDAQQREVHRGPLRAPAVAHR